MVDIPNDALQSHKVSGQNSPRDRAGGQKSLKNPENPEKLSPGNGGAYWGGPPLWDNAAYLHHHRRDIAQTFIVDSPSDALQTHKVSGQNSRGTPAKGVRSGSPPRGGVRGCGSIEPQNHRAIGL